MSSWPSRRGHLPGLLRPHHLVLLIKAAAFSYARQDPVCAFEIRLYTASVVFLSLATVNSVADPIIYVLAAN